MTCFQVPFWCGSWSVRIWPWSTMGRVQGHSCISAGGVHALGSKWLTSTHCECGGNLYCLGDGGKLFLYQILKAVSDSGWLFHLQTGLPWIGVGGFPPLLLENTFCCKLDDVLFIFACKHQDTVFKEQWAYYVIILSLPGFFTVNGDRLLMNFNCKTSKWMKLPGLDILWWSSHFSIWQCIFLINKFDVILCIIRERERERERELKIQHTPLRKMNSYKSCIK